MGENKGGNLKVLVIVAVLCIAGSTGATYFFMEQTKQSEINNLTEQYETEIGALNTQKVSLNSQIENLQNILNTDNQNYIKNMVLGLKTLDDANYEVGNAAIYKYEAGDYYDDSNYYWTSVYSYWAESTYESAINNFTLAKPYFENAVDYAPNNKTLELANLYVNFSQLSIDMYDNIKEAYGAFGSANDYYDLGQWGVGDLKIEDMNDYVEDYNDLFITWSECQSEIDFLLEDFLID